MSVEQKGHVEALGRSPFTALKEGRPTEPVGSRIRDWHIGIADTIADNASAWGAILGDRSSSPLGLDLVACGRALERNGESLSARPEQERACSGTLSGPWPGWRTR